MNVDFTGSRSVDEASSEDFDVIGLHNVLDIAYQ
jgi:hypothetical protein